MILEGTDGLMNELNRKKIFSFYSMLNFCWLKADLLHCKIIIKMYLIENKEVTMLAKLNR